MALTVCCGRYNAGHRKNTIEEYIVKKGSVEDEIKVSRIAHAIPFEESKWINRIICAIGAACNRREA